MARQMDFVLCNKKATAFFKYRVLNMNCVVFNENFYFQLFLLIQRSLKKFNWNAKILYKIYL